MKRFHANRLVKLAQHLATIPEQYFDLSTFAEGDVVQTDYIDKVGLKTDTFDQKCSARQLAEVNCGTTACALGWGATIPAFRRAGLSLVVNIESKYERTLYGIYKKSTDLSMLNGSVNYEAPDGSVYDGFEAGSEFFGLTGSESCYLFDPYSYAVYEHNIPGVIEHIAKVLADYGWSEEAIQVQTYNRDRSRGQEAQ